MIREFVAHLHDHGLAKSSIARKLAALRSFFKVLCARRPLEGKPRASRSHSEVAQAHPIGRLCRRDERVPQSTGRDGTSRERRPRVFHKARFVSAGIRRETARQAESFRANRRKLPPSPRPGAPGTPLRRWPARQRNLPASILPIWIKRTAFSASAARAARNGIVPYGAKAQEPWKNTASAANCSWSQTNGTSGRTHRKERCVPCCPCRGRGECGPFDPYRQD